MNSSSDPTALNELERRVIDISYRHGLAHLSSNLGAVNIIDEIFAWKSPTSPFILSSGHAALALYVVLEKYLGKDAELLLQQHGIHTHHAPQDHIYVSTGSLGMGLTVACGYALADRDRDVYCLISDGECGEGAIWEALRFCHEQRLDNLKIYVNINGQIAYGYIDQDYLTRRLQAFHAGVNIRTTQAPRWPWAQGVLTHYYILKPQDYEALCENNSVNN